MLQVKKKVTSEKMSWKWKRKLEVKKKVGSKNKKLQVTKKGWK